jgi:VanZ family protein
VSLKYASSILYIKNCITRISWRNILFKIPSFLVILALWFFSSQNSLPRLRGFAGSDKIEHGIAYFILTCALSLWFPLEQWKKKGFIIALFIVFIAVIYGTIDEMHQFFTPGRECDIVDICADGIGACIAAFSILILIKIYLKHINNKKRK